MNTMQIWLMVIGLMAGLAGCALRDDETIAASAPQSVAAAPQPDEAPPSAVPEAPTKAAQPPTETVWSEAIDGLRGRVIMSRDHVFNGTAILITKLELCNDGDQTLAFSWSWSRTKYVVADAQGNEASKPRSMSFSGPGPAETSGVVIGPGQTVVVNMTSQGMGIKANLAAALCLGVVDDCWEFPSADTDYFLTATFTIPQLDKNGAEVKAWREEKPPPAGSVPWHGRLELPRVQIPLRPDPLPPNVGELIE